MMVLWFYEITEDTVQKVRYVDEYISCIWTRRYYSCGDFELQMVLDDSMISADSDTRIQCGQFVMRPDDETVMMVEKISIASSIGSASTITISGRSAEALLDRRVLMTPLSTSSNGITLQVYISMMLYYCFGSAKNSGRAWRVSNRILADSMNESALIDDNYDDGTTAGLTISDLGISTLARDTYSGTVYEILCGLAETANFGFKMKWDADNEYFALYLYSGRDKASEVCFAEDMYTLLDASYEQDTESYKNACIVYTENDSGGISGRNYVMNINTTASGQLLTEMQSWLEECNGLNCNETAVLQSNSESDDSGSVATETFADCCQTTAFSGTAITSGQYTYKEDWDVGDTVLIRSQIGVSGEAKVLTVVESDDNTGTTITPTFSDTTNISLSTTEEEE